MNIRKPLTHGRRSFLIGAGGAALALPLLPSLLGRAQDMGPLTRFVSWRVTNGHYGHQWYPSDAAVAGAAVVAPNVRELALRDIAGPVSSILDSGFDRFRDKATLLRHVDRLDTSGHQAGNGLFGWASGVDGLPGDDFTGRQPSIDKLIASHFGDGLPLNLSVCWTNTGRSCSAEPGPDGMLAFDPGLYPHQAYSALFADFSTDTTVAARRQAARRSIVDRVLPHYQSVRDSPRLSRADRTALEQHIEHMHGLSSSLARASIECAPPGAVDRWRGMPEQVDRAAQAQVDIAIAALRCGLARVVNFYLDPDVLFTRELHGVDGHHGSSHEPSQEPGILAAHRWHMRYFFDLLGKMDDTIDPTTGRTLLDESLVLLNNEIGNQNGAHDVLADIDLNHIGLDIQTMLVGSAGGRLRTGLYLDYATEHVRSRWTERIGIAYNAVLTHCMLAMGLTPDEWEVDGQPGYGDLRGAPYHQTPLDRVTIGDLRSFLPRLAAP